MRGSDAGHMTAGQGLTAGQRSGGPGLLSRQARSSLIQPVCQAMWMVSGHGSRLVRESTAKVPVELRLQRLQQLQLGHMQWYQVDLTTGLRQSYPATGRPTRLWLWYQVHTGTGLQQQPLGCRHLVCEWVRQQQPGRRPARPHRCIDMVHRLSGSYRLGVAKNAVVRVRDAVICTIYVESLQVTHQSIWSLFYNVSWDWELIGWQLGKAKLLPDCPLGTEQ